VTFDDYKDLIALLPLVDIKYSKNVFVLATFFAPFHFILPTNFSIYEILLLISGFLFILSNNKIKLPDNYILIGLILLILGYSISILNGDNLYEAIKMPVQLLFIGLVQFPLIYSHVNSHEDVWQHLVMLSLALVVHEAAFLVTFLEIGVPYDRYRYTLFYRNPNHLSQVLLILIGSSSILSYFLIFFGENLKKRSIGFVIGVLTILACLPLFLTLSRSGLVAFVVLSILLLITKFGTTTSVSTAIIKTLCATLLGISGIIFAYLLRVLPDGILIRMQETSSLDSPKILNRIIPWKVAIRSMDQFLFLGSGYNNYESIMGELAKTPLEQAYLVKPHNIFLVTFVEGGGIAAIGLGVISISLLNRWIKILPKEKSMLQRVTFCIPAIFLGYLFASQFGTLSPLRIFWFIIGLSGACSSLSLKSD